MKKFVICDFRSTQGGPIVLEALCRQLIEAGQDARMFYFRDEYPRSVPFLSEPAAFAAYYQAFHTFERRMMRRSAYWRRTGGRYEKKYQPYIYRPSGDLPVYEETTVDDDTIVIYPEVVPGNFLQAKHVVRWLLYHYQFENAPGRAYAPSDLFVAYRKIYNSPNLNPEGHEMHVICFPDKVYRDKGYADRQGDCYIIRKGRGRSDLPPLDGKLIIDGMTETEIAEVFNRSRRCISYDTQTMYTMLAALCGCETIVVPEPGKTRADYRGAEDKEYGVAFGDSPEELAYARKTLPLLRQSILEKQEKNRKQVEGFLALCEKRFGA